jgi:hypothetical protein
MPGKAILKPNSEDESDATCERDEEVGKKQAKRL